MTVEICPECGAAVDGGREACAELYHQLTYQALENVRIASVLTLAFDTYCMQHIETYCVSAKSYAAHLTRLCVGLEVEDQQEAYAALQRWYHAGISRPQTLFQRGTIRITDIQSIQDPEEKRDKILAWAADVWDAYSIQHETARAWVAEALHQNSGKRRK